MSIEVNEKITPEEFARRMREIERTRKDIHISEEVEQHLEADDLLCDVLRSLGYGEGVEIFEEMGKWYE